MDQSPINTGKSGLSLDDGRPLPRRGRLLSWLLPRGLSGKLLVITTIFIMLTEILIFVPSVANYRLTWLSRHFTTGEAAAVALQKSSGQTESEELQRLLLDLSSNHMIGMRFDGRSSILASRDMPRTVERHIRLAEPGRVEAMRSIADAFDTLFFGGDRIVRLFGKMAFMPEAQLQLIFNDAPLREDMLGYARNTMLISLGISLATALLVFLTLRWFFIRPLQTITERMLGFAQNPEDANQIITPSGRHDEIGVTEEQLNAMQRQLRGTMTQQKRLADLGLAVSKINHDLRNILAAASLFTERLAGLNDPTVKRLAPRLVQTIDRAVDYTQSVLAYGKAGEEVPRSSVLRLHNLAEDVAQVLSLDMDSEIEWRNEIDADFEVTADPDQLFRVLLNLCRNSVAAMTTPDRSDVSLVKRLSMSAVREGDNAIIRVIDTGPGFPENARDKLFSAFYASTGKSNNGGTGTGLGLAIAADLIRGHGGTIMLLDNGEPGAQFEIVLPMKTNRSQTK